MFRKYILKSRVNTHRVGVAHYQGFTLIELSIVLVIIGLLIGAIFEGRDLIKAATIHSAVSQIAQYNAAFNTFRSKYNCLPGDCAKATQFFPADSDCTAQGSSTPDATCNGDGNRRIDFGTDEPMLAFQQLYLAGLIKDYVTGQAWGAGPAYPCLAGTTCGTYGGTKSGSICAVYNDTAAQDAMTYDATWNITGHNVFNVTAGPCGTVGNGGQRPIVSGNYAYALDSKIDDGMPSTGTMLVPTYLGTVGGTGGACFDSVSGNYHTNDDLDLGGNAFMGQKGCFFFIIAKF